MNQARHINIEIRSFGPDDIVKINWPDMHVGLVETAGRIPLTKLDGDDALSFWKLPQGATFPLTVHGGDRDGGVCVVQRSLRDLMAQGDNRPLVRINVDDQPTQWGSEVSFSLHVLDAEANIVADLPEKVLSATLTSKTSGELVKLRPLVQLCPKVLQTISFVYAAVTRVEWAFREHNPDQDMDWQTLWGAVYQECGGATYVTDAGLLQIVRTICDVRAEIEQEIDAMAVTFGDVYALEARTLFDNTLHAQMVAKAMDIATITDAGLMPSTSKVLLGAVRLSAGNLIGFQNLPDDVSVQLALPDGSVRDARGSQVLMSGAGLVWDTSEDHVATENMTSWMRSLMPFSQHEHLLPIGVYSTGVGSQSAWIARVEQELDNMGHTMTRDQTNDLAQIVSFFDAPDWLAERFQPTEDALMKVAPFLKSLDFWASNIVPFTVRQRLLCPLLDGDLVRLADPRHNAAFKQMILDPSEVTTALAKAFADDEDVMTALAQRLGRYGLVTTLRPKEDLGLDAILLSAALADDRTSVMNALRDGNVKQAESHVRATFDLPDQGLRAIKMGA